MHKSLSLSQVAVEAKVLARQSNEGGQQKEREEFVVGAVAAPLGGSGVFWESEGAVRCEYGPVSLSRVPQRPQRSSRHLPAGARLGRGRALPFPGSPHTRANGGQALSRHILNTPLHSTHWLRGRRKKGPRRQALACCC
jgi:hypothetical protein